MFGQGCQIAVVNLFKNMYKCIKKAQNRSHRFVTEPFQTRFMYTRHIIITSTFYDLLIFELISNINRQK